MPVRYITQFGTRATNASDRLTISIATAITGVQFNVVYLPPARRAFYERLRGSR